LSTKPSEISDPLIAARRVYLDAVKTRDLEKLVSILDEETVWMPPNDTSLYGVEEVRDWWKEYFEYFRVTSITEPEREVTVSGDFAIEQTSYMIVINPVKGGTRIRDEMAASSPPGNGRRMARGKCGASCGTASGR
jgi:ketosteroid isomerase-like protein